jgi:hypothetical protein
MLNVGCGSGLRNRGIAYREMSQGVGEIEQEDWELRDVRRPETGDDDCERRNDSGDKKKNGEI